MVGSRQVTLSVAKQLDHVDLADLTVFGRVKLRQGEHHVIGSGPDGSLAVAKFKPNPWQFRCYIDQSELEDAKVPVCENILRPNYTDPDWLRFRWGSIDFSLNRGCVDGCGISDHKFFEPESCVVPAAAVVDIIEAAHRQQYDAYAMDRHVHSAAASSPLIVLAGLK